MRPSRFVVKTASENWEANTGHEGEVQQREGGTGGSESLSPQAQGMRTLQSLMRTQADSSLSFWCDHYPRAPQDNSDKLSN